MKLSPHFTLEELIKSSTASRLGIINIPSKAEIVKLKLLCESVLEPVREHYGPFAPSSAFRCLMLNRAIGSGDTSQHIQGEASDFEIVGVDNYNLACWVKENLKFDQLLLEFYDGSPNSGWVHVSFKEHGNRNEILTINKSGTKVGLEK